MVRAVTKIIYVCKLDIAVVEYIGKNPQIIALPVHPYMNGTVHAP